jgi:hypothetical protein
MRHRHRDVIGVVVNKQNQNHLAPKKSIKSSVLSIFYAKKTILMGVKKRTTSLSFARCHTPWKIAHERQQRNKNGCF